MIYLDHFKPVATLILHGLGAHLLETMSHYPIDDSEMSQRAIAHRAHTLFTAVKF